MQHRLRVAPEIGAGHRHDVRLAAPHELADVLTEAVVRVGGNVVELVHRDQPFIESLRAEPLHRETERRMGADQRPGAPTSTLA